MKRETLSFRTDLTFWLAILVLLTTVLSRHVGKTLPTDFNYSSGSPVAPESGEVGKIN